MGRYISFILFSSCLLGLHFSLKIGDNHLPPLGHFLNPFTGFWKNATKVGSMTDQFSTLAGLDEAVQVKYDDRLVPHIFGNKTRDVAFIQGYIHAQHRLWQMDITARQASGRLSEIFGDRTLSLDIETRRMGMQYGAEKHLEQWKSCESFRILEAYVEGVNTYIHGLTAATRPIEFKLFNYVPEAWTPLKTALVLMSMNRVLCSRNEDIPATNTHAFLGEEEFKFLFPEWNPKQSPVIPKGTNWKRSNETILEESKSPAIGFLNQKWRQFSPPHIGSNNWAVSGLKTKRGYPILCNDPHLSLTLPSIWYEVHINTTSQNTYGVSLPGVPFVIIGFNEKIAWGMTNVGMDVLDLYQINWKNPERTEYELEGGIESADFRIETIQIKGEESYVDTVKYTYWGPVYFEDSISLAMHWLALQPQNKCMLNTLFQLSESNNFTDYYQAIESFQSPPQNIVFASTEGDIAIKVQGLIPIKHQGQGKFVQQGNQKENGWKGFVPHSETPMVKNPARGFVSSANQHSTDSTYPYYYHGYFEDYRSRTLNDALSAMDKVEVKDMMTLQNSTYSQLAADLIPLFIKYLPDSLLSVESKQLKRDLENWNYYYSKSSTISIFFELWKQAFYHSTWDEFYAKSKDLDILFPEMWRTVSLLNADNRNVYFDIVQTPDIETARDIVQLSFQKAQQTFDSLQRVNPSLNWTTYKNATVNHLSRIPAFSVDSIPIGGINTALNAMSKSFGPSWRMIVQLGETIEAWGVYPGGQSGNPGNPFYKNMINDWAQGSYYKLHFVQTPDQLDDLVLYTHKFGS